MLIVSEMSCVPDLPPLICPLPNLCNPDASKTIHYGAQTVDEMFNGFVFFVDSREQLNLTVDPKTGGDMRSF